MALKGTRRWKVRKSTTEMKMSEKLTSQDPVDGPTRKKLEELAAARYEFGERLLELEQEKVKLLVAANRVDEERGRLFEKILMDRGLSPNTLVEIEAQTGAIKVLE